MKKLGLALSSGAAKGFAHIGVLQVLHELKIPVHCVTGCSMGSIIGGLYAMGEDVYYLGEVARSIKVLKYIDLTVTRGGFLGGKRFERLLEKLTRNKKFEDTVTPFACIAVEYATGEIVTFNSGSLSKAMRASGSIPGVFVPYEIDEKYYIDGGVLERMPCELCRSMGADIVLGVDVEHRGQEQKYPNNTVEVLRGMMNIAGWDAWQKTGEKPDLLLTPDVNEANQWSSKDSEFCISRGREAMIESAQKLKEMLLIG